MSGGLFDLDRLLSRLGAPPAGVQLGTFGDEGEGRIIQLRHDVDLSLAAAVRLAAALRDHGIRGTFFVRQRAPGYNLASAEGLEAVAALREAGHAVGLHWESAGASRRSLADAVRSDWSIFAEIIRDVCPVSPYVSMHKPAAAVLGARLDEPLKSTYAPPFFRAPGATYRSDSNGTWDWDAFDAVMAEGSWTTFQLLIHPEWWVVNANDRGDVFRELVLERDRWQACWLRDEIDAFRKLRTGDDQPTSRDAMSRLG